MITSEQAKNQTKHAINHTDVKQKEFQQNLDFISGRIDSESKLGNSEYIFLRATYIEKEMLDAIETSLRVYDYKTERTTLGLKISW